MWREGGMNRAERKALALALEQVAWDLELW